MHGVEEQIRQRLLEQGFNLRVRARLTLEVLDPRIFTPQLTPVLSFLPVCQADRAATDTFSTCYRNHH
jgi:hypothetical protein